MSWRYWRVPMSCRLRRSRRDPPGNRRADFTAEPIIQAGPAALANGRRATAARGLLVREAISGFYQQRYGLSIDPQRILSHPGGSGALLASSLLVDQVALAGGPRLPLQPALPAPCGRRGSWCRSAQTYATS